MKGGDIMLPTCKLVGEDGNVFNIIGKVVRVLKQVGRSDLAKEFQTRTFKAGSYDEVLRICSEYVDIE